VRHPRRARSFALLALLAVLALAAPSVLADHAYSHRYILYGRVVDSNGNAVKGVDVQVATRHFFPNPDGCESREGSKTDAFGRTDTRFVTNEYGEFTYCFHEHSMSLGEPGEATISVPSAGFFTNITFDPYWRESFVPIVLSAPHPNATHALDSTYTVLGRMWEPHDEPVTLEGNKVFGLTLVDSAVNVTLTLPNGVVLQNKTRTNDYGDYAVRFSVPARLTGGNVTVEAFTNGTVSESKAVDPLLGMTVFQTKLPTVGPSAAKNIGKIVAVVVVILLALAAIVLSIRALVSRRAVLATSRAARRRNQR
jgi:hypothetical protein